MSEYWGYPGYVIGSPDTTISIRRMKWKPHQLIYGDETEHLAGGEKTAYWVKAERVDIGYRLKAFGRSVDIITESAENQSSTGRVERCDLEDDA